MYSQFSDWIKYSLLYPTLYMVLFVPDCVLASNLLRIASKITSIKKIATQHSNSITTSDSLRRAVDGF